MSGDVSSSPPDEPRHLAVRRQPDALPSGFILRMLLVSVMIAISLCFATHLIVRARFLQLRPSGRFAERELPPPHDVADVRQELFRVARPRTTVQEEQRAGLSTFGWVDRGRRIVRIPIETAMKIVARQSATGTTP